MNREELAASSFADFKRSFEVGPGDNPALATERRAEFVLQCAQTANFARPLARRALITARPLLVFILTRNPWVRLRRVTEG